MKLEKSDLQLQSIVTRIANGELDLQPNFQRGEIWDNKRRQRLVDTILRSWYVPAIHVVVDSNEDELVLDGQQRLAAIRDFFADEIKIDGTIEPHDDTLASLHGLRYSALPVPIKKAVNRFVLQIITLRDYHPQEPNELFFRLNQAYNLTPPEKRNALHGIARDQVKSIVGHLSDAGLLSRERIGFTNGRLAYDDIIARTCVSIESGGLRKHINNTVVENYYRSEEPFSGSTVESVKRSGELLLRQIDSSNHRIRFNKGTLQTWLTYCYWAPACTGNLAPDLLASFENDRAIVKAGQNLDGPRAHTAQEMLRLYDDRASYRVTDVSSVLIRDLAVHAYSELKFGTGSWLGSAELLKRVEKNPSGAQAYVGEYLESSSWGKSIGEGEAPE